MEKLPMKSWAQEDQPIYKLASKGRYALSDAELLSILIGTGNKEENALELSMKILNKAENNLNELAKFLMADLIKLKGITKLKAAVIVAAIELGRRRKETDMIRRDKVTCSKDGCDIFQPMLGDLVHKEFWILFLNRANLVLNKQMISSGGMSGTVVDPKMIFKAALDNKASSIMMCHNHPSGNTKPSDADIKLTRNIKEAGKVLEIPVLDHIIVTQSNFFSFADEGLM